jgi:hypothetical protein
VAEAVALGFEVLLEVFGECAKLERRLRRSDDEVVSEGSGTRDVEEREVQRLVVGEDVDGPMGQGFGIQKARSRGDRFR